MRDRILLFIAMIVSVALLTLYYWIKDRKRDRLPIYESKATIRDKRVESSTTRNLYGARNQLYYWILFELDDGTMVELSAPLSAGYPEGTTGTVIFQGTRCEKFTPDSIPTE